MTLSLNKAPELQVRKDVLNLKIHNWNILNTVVVKWKLMILSTLKESFGRVQNFFLNIFNAHPHLKWPVTEWTGNLLRLYLYLVTEKLWNKETARERVFISGTEILALHGKKNTFMACLSLCSLQCRTASDLCTILTLVWKTDSVYPWYNQRSYRKLVLLFNQ